MRARVDSANPVISNDISEIASDLGDVFQALSGKTLLVTGGSGFLCSYLLETVAVLNDATPGLNCRLISVDNLRTGLTRRIAHLGGRPDFRFISHDVSQPLELDEPVHYIIHGAGIASPTFYRKFPLETIDLNVSG